MAQLRIKVCEAGSSSSPAVLALAGEVDPRSIELLRKHLDGLATADVQQVILDLSSTEYVNSSALAVLVKFAQNLSKLGGGVALVSVNARVKMPFEMLGLLRFFEFFESVAEARATMAGEA